MTFFALFKVHGAPDVKLPVFCVSCSISIHVRSLVKNTESKSPGLAWPVSSRKFGIVLVAFVPGPEVFPATWFILPDFHMLIPKPDNFFFTVFASFHHGFFRGMVRCPVRFVACHGAFVESLCIRLVKLFEEFVRERSPHGYLGLFCFKVTLFCCLCSWGISLDSTADPRVASRSAFQRWCSWSTMLISFFKFYTRLSTFWIPPGDGRPRWCANHL